jgi:hypothetical protein
MWHFAVIQFTDPTFFVMFETITYGFAVCEAKLLSGLKISNSQRILVLLTNIAYTLNQVCTKYFKNYYKKTTFMPVLAIVVQCCLEICVIVICELNIKKFPDFQFADWHFYELCGFVIPE